MNHSLFALQLLQISTPKFFITPAVLDSHFSAFFEQFWNSGFSYLHIKHCNCLFFSVTNLLWIWRNFTVFRSRIWRKYRSESQSALRNISLARCAQFLQAQKNPPWNKTGFQKSLRCGQLRDNCPNIDLPIKRQVLSHALKGERFCVKLCSYE